jgi:uncharacterized membrane protein YhaH (DUF805 family)
MQWYLNGLKNYVGFSGRATRTEFWMFSLFSFIVSVILTVIDNVAGTNALLTNLYSLAVLLPSLAISFRRLHDAGKSAWWLLIGLIPIVGTIILIVFLCKDSQEGENQFGPNPKF